MQFRGTEKGLFEYKTAQLEYGFPKPGVPRSSRGRGTIFIEKKNQFF